MYRIRHRIIEPVLITEEGGEKTCVLSFDRYGCMYTQRHTHAKSQKHACHLPAGIKLALSCTVLGPVLGICVYYINVTIVTLLIATFLLYMLVMPRYENFYITISRYDHNYYDTLNPYIFLINRHYYYENV